MLTRYLRLIYVLVCSIWAIYFSVWLLRIPADQRNPHFSGFLFCIFLVVIIPATLVYWLLFKVIPWAAARRVAR